MKKHTITGKIGKQHGRVLEFASANKYLILLLAICLSTVLVLNHLIVHDYKSLPSPLYGGDYYFQLGQTQHFLAGGSLLDASNYVDAKPHYFILHTFLAGIIAKIFSLDAISAHFYLTYLTAALSYAAFFLLARYFLHDNNYLAAGSALLFYALTASFPIIKYTLVGYFIMTPLFLLALFIFLEKKSIRGAALLGLTFGILGITHNIAFIAGSFVLVCFFTRDIYKLFRANGWAVIPLLRTPATYVYVIPLAIGIPIALLWWFDALFIHYGHTANHFAEWTNAFSSISYQFSFMKTMFKSLFSFRPWPAMIETIVFLIGIGALVAAKKTERVQRIIFFIIVSVSATFHYFITQNIFGLSLQPSYISGSTWSFAVFAIFCMGLYFIHQRIKISWKTTLVTSILIIASFSAMATNLKLTNTNQWTAAAHNEPPKQLMDLKVYLDDNKISAYETILTTKEVGFAVTAMTGRKLLTSRWGHTDPFFDLQERELAEAIILYGNDTDARLNLIKKYDVGYLYWDYFWLQSEWQVNQDGQVVGWFDPLMLFYSAEKESVLINYNISYFRENTWVDPAMRGPYDPKFDLLIITPQNYRNFSHPWNPGIDSHLKEVWHYEKDGVTLARLYKIDTH